MSNEIVSPWALQPGTPVGIWIYGVEHEGIVSDILDLDGLPYVISNSARFGSGAEEPWRVFTAGRRAHVLQGLVSSLPRQVVLSRARGLLNKKWDVFNWNCQHFVRSAMGLPVISPQLTVAAGVFLAVLVGFV